MSAFGVKADIIRAAQIAENRCHHSVAKFQLCSGLVFMPESGDARLVCEFRGAGSSRLMLGSDTIASLL